MMPRSQISQLIKRDGNMCHYCGRTCNRVQNSSQQATKEHVVPRAFGGSNRLDNYVLACSRCNNDRGTALFYCNCEWICGPRIEAALRSSAFIRSVFAGIIQHNKVKVFKEGQRWCAKKHHAHRHFDTWGEAIAYAYVENAFMKGK